MQRVMMVISGRAAPGRREDLYGLFLEHLAPRADVEPAQPLVVWAANDADADGFTLVEIYNDPATLQRNAEADWFWAYMAAAGPLMASEPTVTTCSPMWVKGIDA